MAMPVVASSAPCEKMSASEIDGLLTIYEPDSLLAAYFNVDREYWVPLKNLTGQDSSHKRL